MRIVCSILCLLSFALAASSPRADAESLRVGLEESGFPPFYFKQSEHKPGIYDRILAQAHSLTGDTYEVEYWPQARKLRLFETGQLDIEPGVNPDWRERYKSISLYSDPFAEMEDVFVAPTDAASPFRAPEELAGKRLGTMTGFVYPRLEALFKDGRVTRDDSDDEASMIKKMLKRRIDAGVLWRTVADYYLRETGPNRFTIGGALEAKAVHFRFAVAKKDALDRFNRALQEMKANGRLKEIFDEFR